MQSLTNLTTPTKWVVECGAHLPGGKFTRNHILDRDQADVFRFKYNNLGVFVTTYMYDCENQNEANLFGDFYLDFDYDLEGSNQESAFDVVRRDVLSACRYLRVILGVNQEEILLFFSGKKGIHLIVPKEILGIVPHKNLNRHYKMLAEDINKFTSGKTLDLKIYDNKRLFRMPNSIHQSSKLYKVYLTEDEITNSTFASIKSIAKNTRIIPKIEKKVSMKAKMEFQSYEKKFNMLINRVKTNIPEGATLDYTPPCVSYLLNNPIGAGQRNDTTAFLASFFKQNGLSEDDAKLKLYGWNGNRCTPSLSEEEIDITVESIYSGDAKMGCSTAKTISKCDIEKCKLYRKRRNK